MADANETGQHADIAALDDTVFEAWVDAFTYPSDEAVKGLLRFTAKNGVSTVAEAVRIAGKKRDLQEDEARLKYIGGILRNKRLESTSPELAERLRNFNWLMTYWQNQPRGTGFLHPWMLKDWLKTCTPEEIRAAMDLAGGYYRELREEMAALVESKAQPVEARAVNDPEACSDLRAASEVESREQQEAVGTSVARAEARGLLPEPCLTILRNHPKGATAHTVCAELEKAGVDLTCYKAPVSAIGALLKQIPGVKVTRKKTTDGTIRAYYEIEASRV